MKKLQQTSHQLKLAVIRVTNLVWIILIATLGLYIMDIVSLPVYMLKAYGIGLLLTATHALYKSSK